MRLIWHSNSRAAGTGYGVQSNLFISRLQAAGHHLIHSAFYGSQGSPIEWDGVLILPTSKDAYGNDVLVDDFKHWKADLTITLIDAWIFHPSVTSQIRWAPWFPVDADPLPPMVASILKTAYKPIAYAKFGVEKAAEAGIKAAYVPHGVDTAFYAPQDKAETRKKLGFREEHQSAFVVSIVAANKGTPSRKAFDQQIRAFAEFNRRHPDSLLNLHTDVWGGHDGENIKRIIELSKLNPDCVALPPKYEFLRYMITADYLRDLYNASDVLLNCTRGEGFGVPIIEAMACFPAETSIDAAGVMCGMEREYTGSMIVIETERGIIRATPEHPFWTNEGWTLARELDASHQLLYTPGYHDNWEVQNADKRLEKVHTGAIADVVQSLSRGGNSARGSRSDRDNIRCCVLADASSGNIDENYGSIRQGRYDAFARSQPNDISVSSRANRRGGVHNDTAYAKEQVETDYLHNQHIKDFAGLVNTDDRGAVLLCIASRRAREQQSIVRIPCRGYLLAPALQSNLALSGHKKTPDGIDYRVGGTATDDADQSIARYSNPLDHGDTSAQFERVVSVKQEQVTNLKVYNLKTLTGVYTVSGYLVHNCGVPAIVTDFSAMPELVDAGAGWKVPYSDKCLYQDSYQVTPSVPGIVEALEMAYEAKQSGKLAEMGIQARNGMVATYDADLVAEQYWKPVLAEIEDEIKASEAKKSARAEKRAALRANGGPAAVTNTPAPDLLAEGVKIVADTVNGVMDAVGDIAKIAASNGNGAHGD